MNAFQRWLKKREMARGIMFINAPFMTWQESLDEAEFWLSYLGQ